MRTFPVALLGILLAAPFVAAAGPSATVETLTTSSSCESSYDWSWSSGTYGEPTPNGTPQPNTTPVPYPSYGGWSYYHESGKQSCEASDDLVAAQAGDDAGPLASARVGGDNASDSAWTWTSDHSWGESSRTDSYSSDSHSSSQDTRGAQAQVLGTAAALATGCADRSSHAGYDASSSYGTGGSRSWAYSHTSSWESGCAYLVSASQAGHGAQGGYATGCASRYADASSGSTYDSGDNTTSSYGYRQSSNASDCRSGAVASAEGQDAFAGLESSCEGTSSFSSEGYGDDRWACFDGVVVEAPTGFRLTLGQFHHGDAQCASWTCQSWGAKEAGVTWTWTSAPVSGAPGNQVYLPVLV